MFKPAKPNAVYRLAAMVLCLCVVGGCGYSVAGRGDLPGGVQNIAVQVLENRSSESGVEIQVTNALINELNRRRQGTVTGMATANATLRGTIESIKWETLARRGSNTAAERRVYATISLEMKRLDGSTIWKRSGLTAEQAYTVVDGDKQATANNRRQAIGELSQRIAEVVYRRLTDSF